MVLADALLMVTQNGHHAIRFVIGSELLDDGAVLRSPLVELLLEGDRGVVGTEDFGGEAFHVAR